MYRNSTHQVWCTNPHCHHFTESFEVRWVDDTWEDPGYYLDEECPKCHSGFAFVKPDPESIVDALLGQLDAWELYWEQPVAVDNVAVLKAMHAELGRQWRAERGIR